MVGVARDQAHVRLLRRAAARERPGPHLRDRPGEPLQPRPPGDLLDRRVHRQGGPGDQRPSAVQAPLLPLRRLPRPAQRRPQHARGRAPGPMPEHGKAGQAPPRGVRLRAATDAARLQRGRRLGQARGDVQPGPSQRRGHRERDPPVSLPARIAARDRRRRQARGQGAQGPGRARQHGRPVHLRQRLHGRRAPDRDGQEPPLRGEHPGAAARPRARHRRGREGGRPGDERRPRAHDRRRGRRQGGPAGGRRVAAALRPASGAQARPRAADRAVRRRARRGGPARDRLHRDPHLALQVRRVRLRRDRALRPQRGPV